MFIFLYYWFFYKLNLEKYKEVIAGDVIEYEVDTLVKLIQKYSVNCSQ